MSEQNIDITDFKTDYLQLCLDENKEFVCVLAPMQLGPEDIKQFVDSTKEMQMDEFHKKFTAIVEKRGIIFAPQMLVTHLSKEARELYEAQIKNPIEY